MKIIKELKSYILKRNPPVNLIKDGADLFDSGKDFTIPKLQLVEINDARLYEDGAIFEHGELINETAQHKRLFGIVSFFKVLNKKLFFKVFKVTKDVYVTVLDNKSTKYYHWLVKLFQG